MTQKGLYVWFAILFVFTLLLCVFACQPPLQQAPGGQKDLEAEVKKAVVNMDVLARVTATCLSDNPEMLSVIYNEIGKRLDGDTEVLYETIKDTVLDGGCTIHQILCAAGATEEAQTGTDMEARIRQISDLINLQIYMPNYDEWDGVTPPLVGCYPLDKDEKDIDAITAYDAEGTAFVINEMNYRQRPVFILGYSESVESNGDNATQSAPNNRAVTHSFGDLVYLYGMCIYDTHEGWLKGGNAEIYLSSSAFGRMYLEKVDEASARGEENPWYTFEDLEDNGLLFEWKEGMGTEVEIKVMEDDWLDPDDQLGTITITLQSETRAKYTTSNPNDAKLEIGIVPNTEELVTDPPVLFFPQGDQEDQIPWFEWLWPPRATHCMFMLAVLEDAQQNLWEIIDQRPVSEDDYDDLYGYYYPDSFIFNPENGYYPLGTQFGWKVQGYNDHGDGPWSDPLEFWFSDPDDQSSFRMTVNKLDASGNNISKVYTDLTNASSINIQTPKTVTVGNTTKTFDEWSYQGNASIKNRSSNSTFMENFTSDVTVTAVYTEDCSLPGKPVPYGIQGETDNDTPKFLWSAVSGAATYTLCIAKASNGQILQQITGIIGITGNGAVVTYVPLSPLVRGVDLKWKVKAVNSCGSGPFSAVMNFKITLPPAQIYTMSVTHLVANGGGQSITETYTDLSSASSITISSPQRVTIKDSSGTVRATVVFEKWNFSGTCTVQSVTDPTTVVKNFGSDVNIGASYRTEAP